MDIGVSIKKKKNRWMELQTLKKNTLLVERFSVQLRLFRFCKLIKII
jgi:hypothetical protein